MVFALFLPGLTRPPAEPTEIEVLDANGITFNARWYDDFMLIIDIDASEGDAIGAEQSFTFTVPSSAHIALPWKKITDINEEFEFGFATAYIPSEYTNGAPSMLELNTSYPVTVDVSAPSFASGTYCALSALEGNVRVDISCNLVLNVQLWEHDKVYVLLPSFTKARSSSTLVCSDCHLVRLHRGQHLMVQRPLS